jgi:peptide/nickel transport system substrate-binding protein
VISQVYESLVNRDRDFKLEPSLALSWQAGRRADRGASSCGPNVRFHDGSPFTADDAVFSIERALMKTSQRAFQLRGVTGARKVDDLTIDVALSAPDAVLPDKFLLLGMMSKAWAQKHGVLVPQDYNAKQETFAVRNANGTGPYKLKSYESDNRTVLVAHDPWWGKRGNVDEATFIVIASDATRLAALASGQVDLVVDPPFQDVARLKRDAQFRVIETVDIGTQYLGFDQARADARGVDAQGAQPVQGPARAPRDRARDRHRRDHPEGAARPGGSRPARSCRSWSTGYDPGARPQDPRTTSPGARIAQGAGYGDGFGVTLDCVAITWRAAACQAIAGMLAQVNIKVTFVSAPAATFFPKLTGATSSFFEFGWNPDDRRLVDAEPHAAHVQRRHRHVQRRALQQPEVRRRRRRDPRRARPGEASRHGAAGALRDHGRRLPLIPLYRRTLAWVHARRRRRRIWPNDILDLRFVRVARP